MAKACLFVLAVLLIACGNGKQYASEKNALKSIKVVDSDFSLAYSLKYELDSVRIKVTFIGSLVGGASRVVYERHLTEMQQVRLFDLAEVFPLDSLDSVYVNPNVADGNQKTFVFTTRTTEKTIREANRFNANLAIVVDLINDMVPDSLRMHYKADY